MLADIRQQLVEANCLYDSAAWNGCFFMPADADGQFVTHVIDFIDYYLGHVAFYGKTGGASK